jgi:hypothetical protein
LAKERQVRAKIYKSQRIDADANKSKHHKSEKVKVKAPNNLQKNKFAVTVVLKVTLLNIVFWLRHPRKERSNS